MKRAVDIARLVALRRELHAHAELAGKEIETSRIIRGFVEENTPDGLVTGLGGYGLAVVFDSGEPGPTVMFRTEIDAIPVHETNDFGHRSRHDGVAHKCGHDGHAATVAGLVARCAGKPPSRGRLVLLFQPAEETGAGARGVLEDQQFGRLEPDWIFALHNLPGEIFGEIQIKSGPFTAGSVGAILKLEGRTSHAAFPEQGRSPAAAVAEIIQELGSLEELFGVETALARATVVHVEVGKPAFGTTPGSALVMVTLRSDCEDTLDRLRREAVERSARIAANHGLAHSHCWTDEFPVTMNDPEAVAVVEAVAEARGVPVVRRDVAFPWSEDFGWFSSRFKGAIFGLGSGTEHPALHSPDYDYPDELIPVGLEIFDGIIERLLG
jgi:amidohydrolase